MNLYLSSFRLGNHPELLHDMARGNKKTAVIANSIDYKSEADRSLGLQRELDDLTKLGFEPEELDLRGYFDKAELLKPKLDEYGIVWARGGNAYLLRQAMARSGFDTALIDRIKEDPDFVYGGYSAGIVVLAPTMEGLDLVDDINAVAQGYNSKPILLGLHILPYSVIPHYKSDHPESSAIDNVVEYLDQHNVAYKTLRDGEVLVIRNSVESILE